MKSYIDIITNILQSYTGLPGFVIDGNVNNNCMYCTCFFEDGISINFIIKSEDNLTDIATGLFERYLDESEQYGMNST